MKFGRLLLGILIALFFVGCEKEIEKTEVEKDIESLNQMVIAYVENPSEDYQAIIDLYNKLPEESKKDINKYSEFESLYLEYIERKRIEDIEKRIEDLAKLQVSLNEDYLLIVSNLNDDIENKDVITNYSKFEEVQEKIKELKTQKDYEEFAFEIVCLNEVNVDDSIYVSVNYNKNLDKEFLSKLKFVYEVTDESILELVITDEVELIGLTEGTTTIKVSVEGTENFKTFEIKVLPKVVIPTNIIFDSSKNWQIGKTVDLVSRVLPKDAKQDVIYTVDSEYIEIDGNKATPIKTGKTFLEIKCKDFQFVVKVDIVISDVDVNNDIILFNGVTREMTSAKYWINKLTNPNDIILTLNEIKVKNEASYKIADTALVDILNQKDTIEANTVRSMIETYKVNTSYKINGSTASSSYFNELVKKTNLSSLTGVINVQYGLINTFCALRTFPTSDIATTSGTFDRYQETGLEVGEGCLIYHNSLDANWSFVQARNYYGWVKNDYITSVSKEVFLDYLQTNDFIICTGKDVIVENVRYRMATKLKVAKQTESNYIVSIPTKDGFKNVAFDKSLDVNYGFLPYTSSNVFLQAFKLLGIPYSWGDDNILGHDCSSTMNAIYQCFGFVMARNTSDQAAMAFNGTSFSGYSLSSKKEVFNNSLPGSMVFVSGHVMMYIGIDNNEYYILHTFGSGGGCNITTTSLIRSGSSTYMDSFYKLLEIK